MGLGRPFARSRAARPPAAVPFAARSGEELLRRLRRLHGPAARVWSGGWARRGTRRRLAAVGQERVEGRADADRLASPEDQVIGSEIPPTTAQIQGMSR